MTKLQRNISSVLFVIFLFLVGFLLPHKEITPPTTNIQSVLGQNATNNEIANLYIEPFAGKDFLLKEIESAQKNIFVSIYIISDQDIIDALIQAKQRGVDVRVILENNPFGGGNLNKINREKLLSGGIEVRDPPAMFSLLHQKSLIIDEQKLIIMTLNLSASAFSQNREYVVVDQTKENVADALNIFLSDWERKSYQSQANQLVVSPDNSRDKILLFLNSSQKEIDIEDEVIDDQQVNDSLIRQAKKVITKIILADPKKVAKNQTTAQTLRDGGVQVRFISNPYLHAKLILIDKSFAYIGSVNLTSQSMDRNRELGIIFANPNFVSDLQNQFDRDWQEAKE